MTINQVLGIRGSTRRGRGRDLSGFRNGKYVSDSISIWRADSEQMEMHFANE